MSKPVAIVFRENAMGDILLTIPTLRALAKSGYEVHLVIKKKWQQLSEFLPAKIHYYSGASNFLKLTSELKRLKPSLCFDLQGKLSTFIMRNLIGCPVEGVYKKREFSENIQVIFNRYPFRFKNQKPVWIKYGDACHLDVSSENPLLNLSQQRVQEAKELIAQHGLEGKKFIIINPEASKPGKAFSKELLSDLISKIDLPVVISGTAATPLPKGENVIDLRQKLSLDQLPGVLSLAQAVISSDSGPMHMTRAVNTPLLAIFFQTDPCLGFAPIPSEQTRVISKNLPCKPCSLHGQNRVCPEGREKCREISSEEILCKLKEITAQ